jgi:hypothetical protein
MQHLCNAQGYYREWGSTFSYKIAILILLYRAYGPDARSFTIAEMKLEFLKWNSDSS